VLRTEQAEVADLAAATVCHGNDVVDLQSACRVAAPTVGSDVGAAAIVARENLVAVAQWNLAGPGWVVT
jgi:hypothetical protein